MAMTQSLVNAGSLITKVNFPREALVLAAFGISLFDFLLRVIVIALVFVAYGIAPAPTALALPLLLVPLSLLSVGMGLVFALLNGVLRDTAQMLSVLLPLWMLLTPVVYPMPQTDPDRTLTRLNPVAPFLATAQDLVCGSRLSDASGLVIACIISLTTFLLGWRLFHVTQPRIAERV
jgi:lipopolysaccharide transport system permease protein